MVLYSIIEFLAGINSTLNNEESNLQKYESNKSNTIVLVRSMQLRTNINNTTNYTYSLVAGEESTWRKSTEAGPSPRVHEWQHGTSPWPARSFPAKSEEEHQPPYPPVGIAPQPANQRCLPEIEGAW